MEILIKHSKGCIENQSIRNLKIFAGYKRKFITSSNSFRHYVVIIGYSGGGSQEECSYVMHGSNLTNSKIYRTYSSFPTDWEFEHFNNETNEISIELDELDNEVLNEFQINIKEYLHYSEEEDYFTVNNENKEIINSPFFATPKFPLKILKQLNSVYWPFSITW